MIHNNVITEDQLPKVLASLDKGVPTNFLAKKYSVSNHYMIEVKLRRELPEGEVDSQRAGLCKVYSTSNRWEGPPDHRLTTAPYPSTGRGGYL